MTILSFVASTIFTQYSDRPIDGAAIQIATDEMPSIRALAAARAELRHLETLIRRYVSDPAVDPTIVEEIKQSRAEVDRQFGTYLALPVFGDERAQWSRINGQVQDLNHAVAQAMAQIDEHDLKRAQRTVDVDVARTADAASTAVLSAIEVNARGARDLALKVRSLRDRSLRVALVLDTVCVILTILAALMALRAVRRYAKVLEEFSELQRRRAEELELFAGRVAHDILGPFSTVRIALSVAGKESRDERTSRMVERGQSSVQRVATIVDGLLAFARAGARPEPGEHTNVGEALAELSHELEPVAAQSAIELSVAPFSPCEVACNPGVLSSLVENLVRNAIKYMGDAGERQVTIRVAERGERIRFEVQDTGPGLPPGLEDRMFEPHVRGATHGQPGIGLGLATVRRIVKSHGGTVGVRSTPGVGCLFWFELPRAQAPLTEPRAPH